MNCSKFKAGQLHYTNSADQGLTCKFISYKIEKKGTKNENDIELGHAVFLQL
jgi:hypothetical protein